MICACEGCCKLGVVSRDTRGRGPWYCKDHAERLGLFERQRTSFPNAAVTLLPVKIGDTLKQLLGKTVEE